MIKLICKHVIFGSENDEYAFDEWITRIKCVKRWEGAGDEVHLYVTGRNISQMCLRDLTAFFYRYHIDMQQLRQLVSKRNEAWYTNQTAYWHKGVYGKQPQKARPKRDCPRE